MGKMILSAFSEQRETLACAKSRAASGPLVLSRWMVSFFAVAILLPWLVIVSLLSSRNVAGGNAKPWPVAGRAGQASASTRASRSWQPRRAGQSTASGWRLDAGGTNSEPPPQEWSPGKKGPWGQIESMLFAIDLPDEFVFVPPADQPPVRWSFPGYTKEKVLATLRSAGLPEDEVKKLDGSAKWNSDDGVVSVEPGDPLILSLAPEVRAKLYAILVAFPQNGRQIDPDLVSARHGRLAIARQRAGAGVDCPAEAAAVPAGREHALVRRFRAGLAELAQRRRAEAFHEDRLAEAEPSWPA